MGDRDILVARHKMIILGDWCNWSVLGDWFNLSIMGNKDGLGILGDKGWFCLLLDKSSSGVLGGGRTRVSILGDS